MSGPEIDAAEIAEVREATGEVLPDEATIQRVVEAPDGGGGRTEEWNDLATVPARIDPRGGGEGSSAGDRIDDRTTDLVTLPAETDVTEADRLVIGGTIYEVLVVESGGEWELTRKAQVKETF